MINQKDIYIYIIEIIIILCVGPPAGNKLTYNSHTIEQNFIVFNLLKQYNINTKKVHHPTGPGSKSQSIIFTAEREFKV